MEYVSIISQDLVDVIKSPININRTKQDQKFRRDRSTLTRDIHLMVSHALLDDDRRDLVLTSAFVPADMGSSGTFPQLSVTTCSC